jgi:hypothetical protein
MNKSGLPVTEYIHENLSIVMCYAYSIEPLVAMMNKHFEGEHKYLNKTLFSLSELRAKKAIMELALFLRVCDEDEQLSDYLARHPALDDCGRIFLKDGSTEVLKVREVANKVIHAEKINWSMILAEDGPKNVDAAPILICFPRSGEKGHFKAWTHAEIELINLAGICGMLAH